MPDTLDAILDQIGTRSTKASLCMVKHAGGYNVVPKVDLTQMFGELTELETRATETDTGTVELSVYEQKATEADKDAQQARSKQYAIAIKDGGAITMPKAWKDAGCQEADFGDPTNFRLPCHDKAHVQASLSRLKNAQFRQEYTAAELGIIEARVGEKATKLGIDVSKSQSKSSSVVVGGETFQVEEVKDSLDRTSYVFTHGDAGDDAQQVGLVYRGTLAMLRLPKNTASDEARRLMGLIATAKESEVDKTKGTRRQKQGAGVGDDDFTEAVEDALENLGSSAVQAVLYAFSSCVTRSWWDGGGLEEMDDDTFDSWADQLAQALKNVWRKYGNIDDAMQFMADLRQIKRLMAGGATTKTGRTISRAREQQLREVITTIHDVLGDDETTDDDESEKHADPRTAPPAGGEVAELRAEIKRMKSAMTSGVSASELKGAKETIDGMTAKLSDFQRQIAERDAIIQTFGKQPLPDPLAGQGNVRPEGQKQAETLPAGMAGGVYAIETKGSDPYKFNGGS